MRLLLNVTMISTEQIKAYNEQKQHNKDFFFAQRANKSSDKGRSYNEL